MDKYQRMGELLKDEGRATEVFSGSVEEVLKKLSQNGIEMTEGELRDFLEGVKSTINNSGDEELNEKELEHVAGGNADSYAKGVEYGRFFRKAVKLIKWLSSVFN